MDKNTNHTESLGIPFLNPFLSLRRQTQVFGSLLCLFSILCVLSLGWAYGYHRHESHIRQQIGNLSVSKNKQETQENLTKLENSKIWGDSKEWESLISRIHKVIDFKNENPKADIYPYFYQAQEKYLRSLNYAKPHTGIIINVILVLFLMFGYLNRRKDEIKQDWLKEKEINLATQRDLMSLSVSLQPYVERQFTSPIGSDYKNLVGLLVTHINSIILMIMGFLSGLNRKNGDLQVNAQMLKTLLNQIGSQEYKGFPQIQDIYQNLNSLEQNLKRQPSIPLWDNPPKEQALQLYKQWEKYQEAEQMGFSYISDISSQFKQLESLFEQYGLLTITLDWSIQSLNLDEIAEAKVQMLRETLSQIHQLSDKTRQEIYNINEKLGFYRQKREITIQNSNEAQSFWHNFLDHMDTQQEQNKQWNQFISHHNTFRSESQETLGIILSRMQQVSDHAQEWNNRVIAQQHGLSQMDNLLNDFVLRLQDLNETIKSIRISEAETTEIIRGSK